MHQSNLRSRFEIFDKIDVRVGTIELVEDVPTWVNRLTPRFSADDVIQANIRGKPPNPNCSGLGYAKTVRGQNAIYGGPQSGL